MSVVATTRGRVRGILEGGVHVFRGIPFARPPVGDLRFRAPRPADAWDGERDAKRFRSIAPQIVAQSILAMAPPQPQDEDCLYLNVWTPAPGASSLPVMTWIHGGAFATGSGSGPMYDGRALAERGVVVVTINYRLGALGFLHLPGADGDVSANWGLLDQMAALEWVRDEIAAFGGDPANVTIFGESAGGMSVGCLMGSAKARSLFRRAIPQSGAAHNALETGVAERNTAALVAKLGLSSADPVQLRDIPVEAILAAQAALAAEAVGRSGRQEGAGMRFQPVIDGHVHDALPIEAIRRGNARHVDTLVGTTRDEMKLFDVLRPPGTTEPTDDDRRRTPAWLVSDAGDTAAGDRLLDVYRQARAARGEATDLRELLSAAQTDWLFRVPADRLAEAQASWNPATYAYRFDQPSPILGGSLGACHAVDIPFTFGTHRVAKLFAGEGPAIDALAGRMGDAWVAFARTGNPSTESLPPWPAFDTDRRSTMLLGETCAVVERPREDERRAWDRILV